MQIPTPHEIKDRFPSLQSRFIQESRNSIIERLKGNNDHSFFLIGPCSIHDVDAAIEYAEKVQTLSKKLHHIQLLMRVFFEKPRSRKGWTGLIYDPHLDGSYDVVHGIETARELLIEMSRMGIACVTELLEPLLAPYLDDLISWGMIGARTAASQPHRGLASQLPFPVGFKNGIHGELDTAIYGILSAQEPHTRLTISEEGRVCYQRTSGNPWTHLVLRGSETRTNYRPRDVEAAILACVQHGISPHILIDCSHGNSQKDHARQPEAFHAALDQMTQGNRAIVGLMLESHLFSGKQPLTKDPFSLHYGVSITDSCLGWSETEELILQAEEKLGKIPSVQK